MLIELINQYCKVSTKPWNYQIFGLILSVFSQKLTIILQNQYIKALIILILQYKLVRLGGKRGEKRGK